MYEVIYLMLNEFILIGHVGSDAEVTETKNGTKVVTISLPLFHSYNSEGKKTEWIQCRAFGKRANIVELAKKGVLVAIKGELHYPTWEGEDGKIRSRAYVSIESFRFLEKKKSGDANEKAEDKAAEEIEEVASKEQNLHLDDDIDGFLNGL